MPNATPLALTPEITQLVNGAMDSGNIMLLAAVDAEHKPLLSYRGSTAVFSPTQLSLWARKAGGDTIEAIKQNPHVAMMYRSPTTPLLQFKGRARVVESGEERDQAYALAHAKEQAADADKKGVAIIIDLDHVSGVLGFGPDGPVFCNMARA